MKDSEIFNETELRLLYAKKPELRPLKVPSLDEANTKEIPSISDAEILNQPSLDQVIVEFLNQYEVNVEPRSVGEWNGWDTISAIGLIFSGDGDSRDIASTIFAANRSNQISGAAQDWGTWKRWALDHPNFEQFKDDVFKNIEIHNQNSIKEVEELIRQIKLDNKNAISKVKKKIKQAELENSKLIKKLLEPDLKEYVSQLVEKENLLLADKEERMLKVIKIIVIFVSSLLFLSIFVDFIQNQILKNKVATRISTADKELSSGNYEKAIGWYKEALSLDPSSWKALIGKLITFNDLGKKELNSGNYRKAILFFEQALKVKEKLVEKENLFFTIQQIQIFSEVKINLINALVKGCEKELSNGNYEKGIYWYRKAISLDPDLKEISISLFLKMIDLGKKELNAGNYRKAILLFKEPADLDVDFEEAKIGLTKAYIAFGKIQFNAAESINDYKQVVDLYKKALNLNPNLENKSKVLAELNFSLGKTTSKYNKRMKENYFKKALEYDPNLSEKMVD